MHKLVRTDAKNPDFIGLVKELDAYLAITDEDDHAFYDQFNKLDHIKYVVVVYSDGKAMGCGAIKAYDDTTMEIKRMFTLPAGRGNGVASKILAELEKWTVELGFQRCILETGIRQIEAIGLYEKNGFRLIPNYGQYAEMEESRCYEKKLGT